MSSFKEGQPGQLSPSLTHSHTWANIETRQERWRASDVMRFETRFCSRHFISRVQHSLHPSIQRQTTVSRTNIVKSEGSSTLRHQLLLYSTELFVPLSLSLSVVRLRMHEALHNSTLFPAQTGSKIYKTRPLNRGVRICLKKLCPSLVHHPMSTQLKVIGCTAKIVTTSECKFRTLN